MASTPGNPSFKSAFACIRCFERKVKCDRKSPCSSCSRHHVQCIFRAPKPSRRRRHLAENELVAERLKRLEALLEERGIEPNEPSIVADAEVNDDHPTESIDTMEAVWQMPTPGSTISGPQTTIFKPRLIHNERGTTYVDNHLWSRVAEEIHDAEYVHEDDSSNSMSDGVASIDNYSHVLDFKSATVVHSHPPAAIIHQLWQTFVENVDPLTKILHVPSLQPVLEKVISHIERVSKSFEALMFAIYSMAVLAMTEEQCQSLFGDSRARLLPYYTEATKRALLRTRFMSSTSIVVLQALVLHIIAIRDSHEPRALWSLTGAAIRIAEGMGMRLDGTLLGLSPFETELHRRLWWQLQMHDFRAAELCGQAKFRNLVIDENTPKRPNNIDDNVLFPAMSGPVIESTRPTDMLWIMLRCELAGFAASLKLRLQKQGKMESSSEEFTAIDDLKLKDEMVKRFEDTIETKILRYCDPSKPLHLLTMLGARMSFNLVRFVAHHPHRWATMTHVPSSEVQLVWDLAYHLLEQYRMMQTSPQLRHFGWSVPYFIQWHAIIHLLDTLRAEPLRTEAVKAWQLIDGLYTDNLETLMSTNKPILMAVGNLCLKAYKARVSALTEANRPVPEPPEYITKLQSQREAAKTTREALLAKRRQQQTSSDEDGRVDMRNERSQPSKDLDMIDSTTNAHLPQQQEAPIIPKSSNSLYGNMETGNDEFWLSDALEQGFSAGRTTGAAINDQDTILAESYWRDSPGDEGIDWSQWDVWLGTVGAHLPNTVPGPT